MRTVWNVSIHPSPLRLHPHRSVVSAFPVASIVSSLDLMHTSPSHSFFYLFSPSPFPDYLLTLLTMTVGRVGMSQTGYTHPPIYTTIVHVIPSPPLPHSISSNRPHLSFSLSSIYQYCIICRPFDWLSSPPINTTLSLLLFIFYLILYSNASCNHCYSRSTRYPRFTASSA